MTPNPSSREEWLALIRNKLTILEGCVNSINADTRNTPDARHKARLMSREIDVLTALIYRVRTVGTDRNNEEEAP